MKNILKINLPIYLGLSIICLSCTKDKAPNPLDAYTGKFELILNYEKHHWDAFGPPSNNYHNYGSDTGELIISKDGEDHLFIGDWTVELNSDKTFSYVFDSSNAATSYVHRSISGKFFNTNQLEYYSIQKSGNKWSANGTSYEETGSAMRVE